MKGKKGKIRQEVMDQGVIAGIGNIYSSEILFEAGINPLKSVSKLSEEELKKIYWFIKKVLKRAVKLRGTSIAETKKIYGKEGEKCPRCKTIIKRTKSGGRSSFFCPKCQGL